MTAPPSSFFLPPPLWGQGGHPGRPGLSWCPDQFPTSYFSFLFQDCLFFHCSQSENELRIILAFLQSMNLLLTKNKHVLLTLPLGIGVICGLLPCTFKLNTWPISIILPLNHFEVKSGREISQRFQVSKIEKDENSIEGDPSGDISVQEHCTHFCGDPGGKLADQH